MLNVFGPWRRLDMLFVGLAMKTRVCCGALIAEISEQAHDYESETSLAVSCIVLRFGRVHIDSDP
jgi:hypothetical protein